MRRTSRLRPFPRSLSLRHSEPSVTSLHRAGSCFGTALLLLTAALPFPEAARAEVLVRAQGRCKLMSGGFEAFNGHCSFKHKAAGGRDSFVVKLDDGTDFVFSGPSPQALQVQTYRGIVNVRHNEKPDHDVFVWNDGEQRSLSVRLDHAQNPDVTFDDPAEKATTSSLLGAAVGALIGGMIAGNKGGSGDAGTPGTPVSELQSLVGVKGGNAEPSLTRKGYTYVKGATGGDRIYSYWRQPRTGNCVSVETFDGRYQNITYAPRSVCDN